MSIGPARSPGCRISPLPSQAQQLFGQAHQSTIHQSPSLHPSSLSGESVTNNRSAFPIHSSFLPPSSIPGAIPSVKALGSISEEERRSGLSPNNEMSSKKFLERSLKHMAASASSKGNTKCK